MGLKDHQTCHHSEDQHIGHQLNKADPVQQVVEPPKKGAVFIALVLLRIPLAQPGCKEQNDRNFGKLRGLKFDSQLQPPAGAVALHAQGGVDQQQQEDRPHQRDGGHPPEGLVVDFGDHIHGHHSHPAEHGLTGNIKQGVPVVVVGGGVGGGEHHNQADAQQKEHQHQEGQVHGAPGQLFIDGQITFGLSGHGLPPYSHF